MVLERKVVEAVLRPPYGLSGETRFEGESEILVDLSIEAHRHTVEDAIVVLLAGQIAEAEYWRKLSDLYTPTITSHRTDDIEIRKLSSEFAFAPEHAALFAAHCTERTKRIVLHERSQTAIEEIATQLFDNQAISRDELREILLRYALIEHG